MLKGHVFSKQLFENQIFALFTNTFLNGQNGISDNYLDGMELSYSGSNVTIGSGALCIQGRFLEEDNTTTISAGTEEMYCKLVIEIDLDKTNTESTFLQGAYRIIKSASAYPTLTQTNIVKNNSGVYQYELARFRTGLNGITDFQDMRTFLDFNKIAVVTGTSSTSGSVSVNYPTGFNKDNCVIISKMIQGSSASNSWSSGSCFDTANILAGSCSIRVTLASNIVVDIQNIRITDTEITQNESVALPFKIVLMKIA